MNQKVICNRASICEDTNGCDHAEPHEIQVFKKVKSTDLVDCTCNDSCNEFKKVKCVLFSIDFGLDGMFLL